MVARVLFASSLCRVPFLWSRCSPKWNTLVANEEVEAREGKWFASDAAGNHGAGGGSIFICFRVRTVHHLYGDLKNSEQARVNEESTASKPGDPWKTVWENGGKCASLTKESWGCTVTQNGKPPGTPKGTDAHGPRVGRKQCITRVPDLLTTVLLGSL